jgi:hypothetical protein
MQLNWKNSLLILLEILFLGGFLRLYKLDNRSLSADEYIGANISYGHHQTGEWKFWDWNNKEITNKEYTRGKIYYWQSSKLLDFLPPTEFDFRLISVFWGLIGIVSIFLVSYFYSGNFTIALLSSFLWAVSISSIKYDRHFRMYSMFAPIYLILSVAIYQLLEAPLSKSKNWINTLSQKIKLNCNYLIPTILLLIISFLTHFLTINIFPVIGVYLIIMAFYEWKVNKNILNKYSWFLTIPIVSLIVLWAMGFISKASNFLGFMENNWKHYENIMTDYSHWLIVITFFIFGSIHLTRKNFKRGVWLTISFLIPFLSAIFIWDRVAGSQYIYFIQTFQTILIATGIYLIAFKISELFIPKKWYNFFQKKNSRKILLTGGLIVYLITLIYNFHFFTGNEHFYGEKRKWDKSNYKEVFKYYLKHREENALLVTRNFRNYYYSDVKIPVFDFGGEHQPDKKLTLEKINKLENENEIIWIVIDSNDHDYIRGAAREHIRETYEPIETTFTNDSMEIWKWVLNK